MKTFISSSLKRLSENMPCPLYLVGGFVRDYILYGTPSKDADICAPCCAEDFIKIATALGFKVVCEFKNTGTVKIKYQNEQYEFTSFRYEEYAKGGFHKPLSVVFTKDLKLDAKRRDFKCNAIYYDIKNDKVIDLLGGINDLKRKKLTTVVSSDKVFSRDGLRLFRLVRFSAKHGLTPTPSVIKTAKKYNALILDLTPDRIKEELIKILSESDESVHVALCLLERLGLLVKLFSTFPKNYGYANKKGWINTILSVKTEFKLPLLCLIFSNSKEKAIENLHSLKFSHKEIQEYCSAFNLFFEFFNGTIKKAKLKRLIIDNFSSFNLFYKLVSAVIGQKKNNLLSTKKLDGWKGIYNQIIYKKTPISVKDLALSGRDLISMGIAIKSIKSAMLDLLFLCQENPKLNTPSALKRALKKLGYTA
jgi:tRNA nucleotidyltransferase (CCA-adding enzyme)